MSSPSIGRVGPPPPARRKVSPAPPQKKRAPRRAPSLMTNSPHTRRLPRPRAGDPSFQWLMDARVKPTAIRFTLGSCLELQRGPRAFPFSPCGRRWPEGPDEGSRGFHEHLISLGNSNAPAGAPPHPPFGHLLPRRGEGGSRAARSRRTEPSFRRHVRSPASKCILHEFQSHRCRVRRRNRTAVASSPGTTKDGFVPFVRRPRARRRAPLAYGRSAERRPGPHFGWTSSM